MKSLKQKLPFVVALTVSIISILCMFFAYLVVPNISGVNGFTLADVPGMGAWGVLAQIFHVIVFILIAFILVVALLEILSAFKLVKFEVTFRKVTSYILIKLATIVTILCLVLEMLFLWFTILANKGLVFGAGVFVELGLYILGFVLMFYFERTGEFKDEEKATAIEPDVIIKTDDDGEDVDENE